MKKKVKKGLLIIFFGVCIQLNICCFVHARSLITKNTNAYNSENLEMKIISATSKKIEIVIVNNGNDIAGYSKIFTLYKFNKGKWKEVKRFSKTPKCLCPIKKNSSKTEKIICRKHFKRRLSKGSYKIKWVKTKKFSIK